MSDTFYVNRKLRSKHIARRRKQFWTIRKLLFGCVPMEDLRDLDGHRSPLPHHYSRRRRPSFD